MSDDIRTLKIPSIGGLDTNLDLLQQGDNSPGSAIRLLNYESSLSGGYRRVSGFTYYDEDNPTAPGTGGILGICVFNSLGLIVARKPTTGSDFIYKYNSGWDVINTHTPTFTGVDRVRFIKFNWYGDTVAIMDGVNPLQTWDGTTWTNVTGTDTPTSPKYGSEFKNHLFVSSGDSILKFSAPLSYTDWTAAGGGGEINVGFPIVAIKAFRDELFVFGQNSIKKVTGTNLEDWVVSQVTTNMGCIAPDSVVEINSNLHFLAPDGIRPIAGTDRVGDVEIETVSKPIQSLLQQLPSLYDLTKVSGVVIRGKSQFRYFFSDGSATGEDSYGILGCLRLRDGILTWEYGELYGMGVTCADSDYVGETEYVVHGNSLGEVLRQETGTSFNGENILSIYQTPWLDFTDTPIRKNPHKLWLFTRSEGQLQINISVSYDWYDPAVISPGNYQLNSSGVSSVYNSILYDASAEYDGLGTPVIRLPIEGSGYAVSIKYVTNDTRPSHHIQGFVLEYRVGDRR